MNTETDTLKQSLAGFRADREADWKAFDALLSSVERRSPKALTENELLSLPVLYRSALSSLSVARATSLDKALIAYLESLCLRGYLYLYGVRRGIGRRLADFFVHDWPAAVRDLWRETLASFGLTAVGAIAGFRLVALDKSWFDGIIPTELAGGRGPDASPQMLREMLYAGGDEFLSGFAAFLFVHNVQVSLMAFALGFALCVPTVLLLLLNGCVLGAFFQVYWSKGLGFELTGWLSIHGTTELFAIMLAGAAGLRIGTRIAFPGELTRMAAAAQAGRVAAAAMVGVTIMLLVAGVLEGVGRQTINSDATRYAIGGGMLVFWLGYFYLVSGVRRGDG